MILRTKGLAATPLRRSASLAEAFSRNVGAVAPATSATIHRSPVHSCRRRDRVCAICGEAPGLSENAILPASKRERRTSFSSALCN